MHRTKGHQISCVQPGSIASELGLQPGDSLLMIDGQPLLDVFDYRLRQLNEQLLLTVCKAGGELIEFDIEKDDDEDLGLEFENPLLDECSGCQNHCVFCFIDQLPSGLRPSLYFKDDDLRLSFLTGNYVSLTNISVEELDRLISYRLSPMNVSVHATDPALRLLMMRHRDAGAVFELLQRIAAAGIAINAQIVLCPGLNDGPQLSRTIRDLAGLGQAIQSIAVVPVGITRYREGNRLFKLQALTEASAAAVLAEVQDWQEKMLAQRHTRLIYAADEFYLKAGWALPPVAAYEDFPQLENGVGMASLFRQEMADGLDARSQELEAPLLTAWPAGLPADSGAAEQPQAVLLVTGTAALPVIGPFLPGLAAFSGLKVRLQAVTNRFFGETITVAGLLTGQDLAAQLPAALRNLPAQPGKTRLVLPACMLKADESLFLDDWSLQQLADRLGVPIHVCRADAPGLLGLLAWLAVPKGVTLHE